MKTWLKRHSKLYRFFNHYIICSGSFSSLFTQKEILLNRKSLFFYVLSTFLGLGAALSLGYHLAFRSMTQNETLLAGEWQEYLQNDRQKIKHLERETKIHLQMLTESIGRIEANLFKINHLADRWKALFEVSSSEFDFEETTSLSHFVHNDNLLKTLNELDAALEKKAIQMSTLQEVIQMQLGQQELALTGPGKAVTNGRVSSFFGLRKDPFTGRKAWHSGVDIAGKEGQEIKALATGVVSYSALKGGYGGMVEINHGNGLATRYAHTKANLVEVGELVKKGQPIALLGSSGRSTGPHLHLEVQKAGKAVNPGDYFPDLKRK